MDLGAADLLLGTTRSVRRRLDLHRPVDPDLIRASLEVAVQAPNGGNANRYHFVVITDPAVRRAAAEIYRLAYDEGSRDPSDTSAIGLSSDYLADHLHEVPVLIIPCLEVGQGEPTSFRMATRYGSILPATWSLMLALRARGLGSAWTTIHLLREQAMADLLGIPANVLQVALLPVAHFRGEAFKAAPRIAAIDRTHWDRWG